MLGLAAATAGSVNGVRGLNHLNLLIEIKPLDFPGRSIWSERVGLSLAETVQTRVYNLDQGRSLASDITVVPLDVLRVILWRH